MITIHLVVRKCRYESVSDLKEQIKRAADINNLIKFTEKIKLL